MKISLNAAYSLSRIAGVTATLMLGLFVYTLFNRTFGDWLLNYPNGAFLLLGNHDYRAALVFMSVLNIFSTPVPIVFAVSLILSEKGSIGGRFVWLGSLVCFITLSFMNTVLLFGTEFPFVSIITFLSISTLVLSALAFIGGFLSIDPKQIAGGMVLTYGGIMRRRGWTILYFLYRILFVPNMSFPFIACLFDHNLNYTAKFISVVIILSIVSLYSVYIVNILLLRKNHPLGYVLTPILLAMDLVPCNFPYSLTSIFAIILFVRFMRDFKGKQGAAVVNTKP